MKLTYIRANHPPPQSTVLEPGHSLLCEGPWRQIQRGSAKVTLALAGHIANAHSFIPELEISAPERNYDLVFQYLAQRYWELGAKEFAHQLHGSFFLFLFDHNKKQAIALSDPMADHFFFYGQHKNQNIVGNDLNEFYQRGFLLNQQWVNRYFKGRFDLSGYTPLEGVRKNAPGQALLISDSGHRPLTVHTTQQTLQENFFSQPDKKWQDAAQECHSILCESLTSTQYFGKKPTILLSQGIDSVTEVCLSEQLRLQFATFGKIYEDADNTHNQILLNNLVDSVLSKQPHVVSISNQEVEAWVGSDCHSLPAANYWSSRVIDYNSVIKNVMTMGGDLVVSGHGGDEAFLHRFRYKVALEIGGLLSAEKLSQYQQILLRHYKDPQGVQRLINEVEQLFAHRHPQDCYSYRPSEIRKHLLRELFIKYGLNPVHQILGTHPSFIGNSYDREHTVMSGIPCFSPYRDFRILQAVYSLPLNELLLLTEEPLIQDSFVRQSTARQVYGKKSTNFVPSSRVFPLMREELKRDLKNSLELVRNLNIYDLKHYWDKYSEEASSLELENVRLLSFYYWHQKMTQPAGPRRGLDQLRHCPPAP